MPDLGYNASYPHNKVEESQSGHVSEVDDTPGSERLTNVHKSGTFEVIKGDGARVVKITGEDFEMVLSNKTLKVSGNLNIVSDGDINFKAGGSIRFETGDQGQFRVKTGVAVQFESMMYHFANRGAVTGTIFNVNGAIGHVPGPFVIPGVVVPPIPDVPNPDIPVNVAPTKITLGE